MIGDLRDAASLKKAVSGCDVVFHVAADYRLWVRDPDEMYRSNVEGTRAILEAARESKVRRVVYTSSVATMGFKSNGHLADEDFSGFSGQYDWPLQAFEIYGGRRSRSRPANREWMWWW